MSIRQLIVNGNDVKCDDGLTVSQLLIDQKAKMPEMVSVELNGQILRRNDFATTALKEEDGVEFLYFMGGGRGIN